MRVVAIKIDESLLEKIDKLAKEHGCYRSEVIRLAIQFLLKLQENGTLSKAEIEKFKTFRCNDLGQ
jgi:metal-responsive CopG/Arc/MetJ family transcriptional regulator